MEAYWMNWLALLLRWAHFVVGIAWIGSSFYFVWLDARLHRPPADPESDRVAGDLWSVHGGGFYHAQKYQTAPATLPDTLHWFKWEAYTTWLTGFALLIVVYYTRATLYLVDPVVADLSSPAAVSISVGLLVAGWIIYDGICRLPIRDSHIAGLGLLLLLGLSYGLSQVFSGRGVFIQIGAMLGTMMAANVLMVIIPGQRKTVAALERGEEPDPAPGVRGKQRSVHNNYMTLPVLFVMLSGHYPITFGHRYGYLVLIALFAIGALVRHYFNLRNTGRNLIALPIAAVTAIALLAFVIAPQPTAVAPTPDSEAPAAVSTRVAFAIVQDRCTTCHSRTPTHPTAPIAPKGVMLDTPEQLVQWAEAVHQQTVVSRVMPLANLTGISEVERSVIDAWFQHLQ